MGLYEIALGGGFVLALVWSIKLAMQREANRRRSVRRIEEIMTRIQGMEKVSECPDNSIDR